MSRTPRRSPVIPESPRRHRFAERRRARSLRPSIEGLESRVVMSQILWNTTANPTGGNWDSTTSWMGGQIPKSGDDAVINTPSSGSFSVALGTNDSAFSLSTSGPGTLVLTGGSLTLGHGNSSLASTTVASGATLNVAANANVTLQAGQTINDSGALNFATGDTMTFGTSYNAATRILVAPNSSGAGTLTATGTNFTGAGGGYTQIEVGSGGELKASNSTFGPNYLNFDVGSVLKAGDLSGDSFAATLTVPAADVAVLGGTANAGFQVIDVTDDGTFTSGKALALNQIGTDATKLSYVLPAGYTVKPGATLNVGPGVSLLLPAGQTINDSGALNFATGDTMTFGTSYNAATRILVAPNSSGAGTLTATGTNFTGAGGGYTQIEVGSGGELKASNSTFGPNYLNFDVGSVLKAGDLSGDSFAATLTVPAADVAVLGGTANAGFQVIDVTDDGTFTSGKALALNQIGTDATKLSYVLPAGYTVKPGATLNVGPGVSLLLPAGQTINDSGALNFATGDTMTFGTSYNAATRILVAPNSSGAGTLTATGTNFTGAGGGYTQIEVGSGGELKASNSTFGPNYLNFDVGSVLKAGDLSGDSFAATLTVPAADVAVLGGTANAGFQVIDVTDDGTFTSGKALALNQIGTDATKLSYVLPAGYTVKPGATLNVGPGVSLLLPAGQTINDSGALNFATGDTMTFGTSYNAATRILVAPNSSGAGTLTATGTNFTGAGGGYTQIEVGSGGELKASNSTFGPNYLNFDVGSVLKAGDLSGDSFAATLTVPAADVAVLGGTANAGFQVIDVTDDGTFTSGKALALNQIGTDATKLSYVLPAGYTVKPGATLNVGPGVSLLLPAGQTINDSGALNFATGDTMTFGTSYNAATRILVAPNSSGAGTLTATGTNFTGAGGGYTQIEVGSGGSLTAIGSTFGLDYLSVSSGSIGTLHGDTLFNQLDVTTEGKLYVTGNDFSHLNNSNNGVIASGTASSTINLDNNYWGPDNTQIGLIIDDHSDNASLPTVSAAPLQSAPAAITGLVFNDYNRQWGAGRERAGVRRADRVPGHEQQRRARSWGADGRLGGQRPEQSHAHRGRAVSLRRARCNQGGDVHRPRGAPEWERDHQPAADAPDLHDRLRRHEWRGRRHRGGDPQLHVQGDDLQRRDDLRTRVGLYRPAGVGDACV